MDYLEIINDLIAFCQSEGVLSSNSDVWEELENITGYSANDLMEDFIG